MKRILTLICALAFATTLSVTTTAAAAVPSVSGDYCAVKVEQMGGSSAKAYAACWVSLYTAPSYGGTQLLCTPNCATLGSLNDRVLSLVFRPNA